MLAQHLLKPLSDIFKETQQAVLSGGASDRKKNHENANIKLQNLFEELVVSLHVGFPSE